MGQAQEYECHRGLRSANTRILYFAGARDAAGKASEPLELPGPMSVGELLDMIVALHPDLGRFRSSIRVAVNHEIVPESCRLKGGEEIGILPPVAGG